MTRTLTIFIQSLGDAILIFFIVGLLLALNDYYGVHPILNWVFIGLICLDILLHFYGYKLKQYIIDNWNTHPLYKSNQNLPVLLIPLFKDGVKQENIIKSLYVPYTNLTKILSTLSNCVVNHHIYVTNVPNVELMLVELNLPRKLSTVEYFHLTMLTNLHRECIRYANKFESKLE